MDSDNIIELVQSECSTPEGLFKAILKLKEIKRFNYHGSNDSVYIHGLRMFDTFSTHIQGDKEDIYTRLAIHFHDFNERYIGDIATICKDDTIRAKEVDITRQASDAYYRATPKGKNRRNLQAVLNPKRRAKRVIKVLDTHDALMYCSHQLSSVDTETENIKRASYLGPFFNYLRPDYDKGFYSYLGDFESEEGVNLLFANGCESGVSFLDNWYNGLTEDSFTPGDIGKIVERETINAENHRESLVQGRTPELVYPHELGINSFKPKLLAFQKKISEVPMYNDWRDRFEGINTNHQYLETALKKDVYRLRTDNLTRSTLF